MIKFQRTEYDCVDDSGQSTTTGVADDGTIITRVSTSSGNPGYPRGVIVYYKFSRPEVDKQRVRLRWEEVCKYGLHREHGVFALDQHDNMFWVQEINGKLQVEVLPKIGYDKDEFPLYRETSQEIIHPNVLTPYGIRTTFYS
jgi:hypothetical protein